MRHLSFDLAQEMVQDLAVQPLRNLDEERGHFAIVMMALQPIRRQPVPSESFGRREPATLH